MIRHMSSDTPRATGLETRLERPRASLGDRLQNLLFGRQSVTEDLMEEVETALLTADVGVNVTQRISDDLHDRLRRKDVNNPAAVYAALREQLTEILGGCEQAWSPERADGPYVILVVGVNGSGKTTTIGKLARRFRDEGRSVTLAAGDTFRAAAVEQLQRWGERHDVPVITQKSGADAASVIFDAMASARSRGADVLIADTAGRLHTRSNLMEELKKIKRVIQKQDASAPHEIMLVVDGTTGQNALTQAREFNEAMGVTGITITKLDGTARGGILFSIAEDLGIPIRFVGVGESAEDLRPFHAAEFVDALLPASG
jgi:fused signal recognition particle receptor